MTSNSIKFRKLIKALEDNERDYWQTDLEKTFKNTNEATNFVLENRNKRLQLMIEVEDLNKTF